MTMVRENRAYLTTRKVDVPWTNKKLSIKWEHFVSKLEPAQKETWTAVITGPDAKRAAAEMVAALYDESLDAYLPHAWMQRFNVFREDSSTWQTLFANSAQFPSSVVNLWRVDQKPINLTYRSLPASILADLWGYGYFDGGRGGFGGPPGMVAGSRRAALAQDQAAAAPMAAMDAAKGADRANEAEGLQRLRKSDAIDGLAEAKAMRGEKREAGRDLKMTRSAGGPAAPCAWTSARSPRKRTSTRRHFSSRTCWPAKMAR